MKCNGNAIFPPCHFEDNCTEGFKKRKVRLILTLPIFSFQGIITVFLVVLCRIIQTNYVS